jgi:hypothetical protein
MTETKPVTARITEEEAMPRITEVYEVPNTFTSDMSLDEQIEAGCNDWRADCSDGSVHFGRTEAEARKNAENTIAITLRQFANPNRLGTWFLATHAGPRQVRSVSDDWWVTSGTGWLTESWCCHAGTLVFSSPEAAQASIDAHQAHIADFARRYTAPSA